MSEPSGQPIARRTVAQLMRPAVTTANLNDHVAAAAYLMKHARTTALVVLGGQPTQPVGIITDTDVAHVVADGKDANDVRISEVMSPDLTSSPPIPASRRPPFS